MVFFQSFLVLLAFFSVNGSIREAKDEEFPFQVSIQNYDRRHLCGGAIITPKWVLTAKSCLESQRIVKIAYGTVDSNAPLDIVNSLKIVLQKEFNLQKRDSLALIELEKPIEFSKTVKPAGLPTSEAVMQNTTKLSGWDVKRGVDIPPNLSAIDKFYVITKDCTSASGSPVNLAMDEFCGTDDYFSNELFNPGSTVSKSAVVLGILANSPMWAHPPYIYVKLSEHEQWIKAVLQTDAQHVNWVDKVPKDSAPSNCAISLALMGFSAIFLRFI